MWGWCVGILTHLEVIDASLLDTPARRRAPDPTPRVHTLAAGSERMSAGRITAGTAGEVRPRDTEPGPKPPAEAEGCGARAPPSEAAAVAGDLWESGTPNRSWGESGGEVQGGVGGGRRWGDVGPIEGAPLRAHKGRGGYPPSRVTLKSWRDPVVDVAPTSFTAPNQKTLTLLPLP